MTNSIANVIEKGFCIGCGLCTMVDLAFRIRKPETGLLQVAACPSDPSLIERASNVCPFAEAPDRYDRRDLLSRREAPR